MNKFKYKFKKISEDSTISSSSGFQSGGEGENYSAPISKKSTKNNASAYFKAGYKPVKEFKYKLKKKEITEANTDVESFLKDLNVTNPDNKKFIASRILGFDEIETKLNQLLPLLQKAKQKTINFYRNDPESFTVLYGTDIANDYINDLLELFTD